MIKKILLLTLFLNLSLAFATETIQAGAKYNEASARVEAFKGVQKKIAKDFFRGYLKDINREENLQFIKDKILNIEGKRYICPFFYKDNLIVYAITYYNMPDFTFYYSIFGNLVRFDVVNQDEYPRKIIGYSKFGNMMNVTFEVSSDEQFIYNENGKLKAHWVGSEMRNKKNSLPKFINITRGIEE